MTGEYRLSERAAQDIADIYVYSHTRWGEERADAYVESLYRGLKQLAARPDRNTSRNKRSAPFRMTAVQQHFILFEMLNDEVIILAILHQSRNVEKHVAKLTPGFRDLIRTMTRQG